MTDPNPTPTGQDEARRALADKIIAKRFSFADGLWFRPALQVEEWDLILAALRAPSLDRGAEEWNYDMEAAPKGPGNPVLVSVPAFAEGHAPFVGEAYYHEDEPNDGWWWAGTSPSDYWASPIREVNAEPIAWRHLPKPAALPVPADLNEGGRK